MLDPMAQLYYEVEIPRVYATRLFMQGGRAAAECFRENHLAESTSCPHKQRESLSYMKHKGPWEILRGEKKKGRGRGRERESGMAVYWARETNAKKGDRANDVLPSQHYATCVGTRERGRKMATASNRNISSLRDIVYHPSSVPSSLHEALFLQCRVGRI